MAAKTGRAWVFADDVDTDLIYHNKYLAETDPKQMPQYSFEYYPGMENFAKEVKPGDYVVAGKNFGCGSSREHAVYCLQYAGVPCILAETCSRIYYRNAINNGLLLIECDLADAVTEGDVIEVEVNHCIRAGGREFPIPKIAENVFRIVEAGGLVKYMQALNRVQKSKGVE